MNMIKLFLAGIIFAVVTSSNAAELNLTTAKKAFSAWAAKRTIAGYDLSSPIKSAESKRTKNGNLFYMFKLEDGKTVFTSGKAAANPVIAFTPNPISKIDDGSPLAVLLEKDLAIRASASNSRMIEEATQIDDIRVAPFLKTKWGQSTAYTNMNVDAAVACFNFFAPSNKVTHVEGEQIKESFYVISESGCVATAMAQIMRYWMFPSASSPYSAICSVPGDSTYYYEDSILMSNDVSVINKTLQISEGEYAWDLMTEEPLQYINGEWIGEAVTEENCKAIGKLIYDCGVSVGTEYNSKEFGGSGLSTLKAKNITDAFKSTFGFANAVLAFNDPALSSYDDASARAKAILSNLDAKRPVLLIVTDGIAAHAAVADGYGFSGATKTPYVHLNMGWAGQGDVWYNLPDIDAVNSPDGPQFFSVISSVCYNISPDNTDEIISGRVTDENAKPLKEAEVNIFKIENSEKTLVATVDSDENGIYFATVPAGFKYKIHASKNGDVGDGESDIIAKSALGTIGNSWGNDIIVADPYVRIGDKYFGNFKSALEEAQRIALGGTEPVIEILRSIHFEETVTIGCCCTISTPNDAGIILTFSNSAKFDINGKSKVTFDKIIMNSDNDEIASAIAVKSGTCVISGITKVDVIYLKDLSCKLEFAGRIQNPVAVVSPKSNTAGKIFATSGVPLTEIGDSAALISNGNNLSLNGVAKDDGNGNTVIEWGESSCPEKAAVAKLKDAAGEETYFRSLDLLFKNITNDSEVSLLKSSPLTAAVLITNSVSINMSSERFDIWLEKTSLIKNKTHLL
jgi:hypothetical protein